MGLFGSAHPQCSGPCQTALPKALWGQMDSLNQTVTKLQLRWDWISMIIWLSDNINLVIVTNLIQTDQQTQNHQAQLDATWAQCSVRLLCPRQTPESDVKLGEMSGKLGPDDASRRTCPKSATATLDSDDHKLFLQLNMAIIINRTRDYWFLLIIMTTKYEKIHFPLQTQTCILMVQTRSRSKWRIKAAGSCTLPITHDACCSKTARHAAP